MITSKVHSIEGEEKLRLALYCTHPTKLQSSQWRSEPDKYQWLAFDIEDVLPKLLLDQLEEELEEKLSRAHFLSSERLLERNEKRKKRWREK